MDGRIGLDNAFSDVLCKRNLLLLALFWSGSLILFLAYGTVSGRFQGGDVHAATAHPVVAENETGSFSAWRHDGAGQSQASYRVVFDNLSATNRALGVFRTASHKRVQIDNLHVAFIVEHPTTPAEAGQNVKLRAFCDLFAPQTGRRSGERGLGVFDEFGADESDWSVAVDLSNAAEVRIKNLDWSVCVAEATTLRVQSRYACLRSDATRVTLRGHVTVTTPEAVLESNCIEMDVQEECFVVDGRYLLTRGGRRQKGQRGRFDAALRAVSTESLGTRENEAWADGLWHGRF